MSAKTAAVGAAALLGLLTAGAPGRGLAADAPVVAASRIDAVTVYLDRALVSRSAKMEAGAGLTTVVFAGLPSEIDDGTLRVKLTGKARLESLRSRKTFLAKPREEELRRLESERRDLAERIQEQRDVLAALEGGGGFLGAVANVRADRAAGEIGGKEPAKPEVADYRAVLTFLTDERIALSARVRKARAALSDLEPQLAAKEKGIREWRASAGLEQKEVVAVLRAEEAGTVDLTLSYMLPGALWFPVYDVRAEREKGAVELTYSAVVQQATGEPWDGVKLTLSAARPAVQIRPPEVEPRYLTAGEAHVPQQRADGQSHGGKWSPSQSLNWQYENRAQGQKQAHRELLANCVLAEQVYASVEKRSTSAVFAIDRLESVATDGKPHRVDVTRAAVPVRIAYLAVPAQSENTYVIGKGANAAPYPLLPGAANVFLGSDLIGTSAMEFAAPGEPVDLYLGVDASIRVTRELDSRKSSTASFSSRRRLEVAYVLRAQSFRHEPVEISIQEALPVSQDERVRVRLETPSVKPAGIDRGIARWSLRLEAGRPQAVEYGYSLEYPEGVQVAQADEIEEALRRVK